MSLKTVTVKLADKAYDIHIGPGALAANKDRLLEKIGSGQATIITDETVWQLHGARLLEILGQDVPVITIAPGEASKSFANFERLSEAMLNAGVGRDGTVVAFGGGVVGDLAGFCASTLRRGCSFIQIPTTLLAQVDSSVGGKTAINSSLGKNLIGAFHQPSLVLADTNFLATLPDREMRAGYAEVVKYGVLGDADFYAWLEVNGQALYGHDADALVHAITVACTQKAMLVAQDEHEKDARALLNLGHTFGHAIEAIMGYNDRINHGEAVAIGMVMAARFSEQHSGAEIGISARIAAHLSAIGLPSSVHDIDGFAASAKEILALFYQDKKTVGGMLTLILLRKIGDAFIAKDTNPEALLSFLTQEVTAR